MLARARSELASWPVESELFRQYSTVGLVWASDLAIAVNCSTIAALLHFRRLVPISGLPWGEIGKTIVIAAAAAFAAIQAGRVVPLQGSRLADFESLALTTLTWFAVSGLGFWVLKSTLLHDLRRRK